MTYFAEPNYLEYELWFDSNINAVHLINYSDEKEFCNLRIKNFIRYQV